MNKLNYWISGALLCGSSAMALAGGGPAGLEAGLQQALNNRFELKIEREKILAARARLDEINSAFLPTVTFLSEAQNTRRFDTFSGTNASTTFAGQPVTVMVAANTPRYQTKAAIELNYNVYKGGGDQARAKEALLIEQAAVAQYSVTAHKILLEVTEAGVSWMKAVLVSRQARRMLELVDKELTIAQGRNDLGTIAAIDLRVAGLKRQTKLFELRSARRTQSEALRKYCLVTGISCSADRASDNVADSAADNDDELTQRLVFAMPDVRQLYAQNGLVNDAEILKARLEQEASGLRLIQVRADHKPSLDLFARYSGVGRSDASFNDARSGAGREVAVAGIRLSWPIFDGFKTDARGKQEVAVTEQLRLKQEILKSDLDEMRRSLEENVTVLQEQLDLEKMQLELAQEQEKISAHRLQLNTISDLEHLKRKYTILEINNRIDNLQIDLMVGKLKLIL